MNTLLKSSSPGNKIELQSLLIRAPNPDEHNLIKASWFSSYAHNTSRANGIRRDIFDQGQNALIAHLLEVHPPVVALFKSVLDEVIGWVCRDFETVQYVYVKHDYRRQGVGNLLISGAKFYTHETKAGSRLFTQAQMLFNPYKAGVL